MKLFSALALTACLTLVGCADTGTEPSLEITSAANRVEADVSGMDCSGCTGEVCGALAKVPGVTDSHADLATGKVTVALEEGADAEAAKAEIEKIIAGLSDGKYTVNSATAISAEGKENEEEATPDQDQQPEGDEQTSQADAEDVFVFASYKVKGMDCGGCSNQIVTAVEKVDGVKSCEADHKTGTVTIAIEDRFDDKRKFDELKQVIAGLSGGKYTVAQ